MLIGDHTSEIRHTSQMNWLGGLPHEEFVRYLQTSYHLDFHKQRIILVRKHTIKGNG